MPEIMCPICGTPNPPDAVICSMCHSRLVVTPGKTQSLTPQVDSPAPEKENLEWLERVRVLNSMDQLAKNGGIPPVGEVPQPASTPVPEPEPEVQNPDWLYNTRDLNSDQGHPTSTIQGEDLSWLNDLRASTGSLGPPPNPTSAAEVLAAAAVARHLEHEEEEQIVNETQQLAPRISIPGSASDWLDKLGAIPEGEPLKEGFEDLFGTPQIEPEGVIEYDIERATGSLDKPTENPAPQVEIPTPPSPSGVEVAPQVVPLHEEVPAVLTGLEALASLDDLFAGVAAEKVDVKEKDKNVAISDSSPAREKPQPAGEPAAQSPDLSWLQDVEDAPPDRMEEMPTQKPATQVDLSREDLFTPPITPELPADQNLRDLIGGRINESIRPGGEASSTSQGVPAPVPPISPASAGIEPDVLKGSSPLRIAQMQPRQAEANPSDLSSIPGFAPTGLTGFLNGDVGVRSELDLGGVLPEEEKETVSSSAPVTPPANIIAEPTMARQPQVSPSIELTNSQEPAAIPPIPSISDPHLTNEPPTSQEEMQAVDITAIPASQVTPDWLKQYGDDFIVEDDPQSIFPSQESLNQGPPAISEFAPPPPSGVTPSPAEVQNQEWLNTVINETPSTPLDLFKDVEEPTFAPTEVPPSTETPVEPVQNGAPWSMEPSQRTGLTGPLPDWLQELEGEQEKVPETQNNPSDSVESSPDLFMTTAPAPEGSLRSAFPAIDTPPQDELAGIPLGNLGLQPETLFPPSREESAPGPLPEKPSLGDFGIKVGDVFPVDREKPDDQASLVKPTPQKSTFPTEDPISRPAAVMGVQAVSQGQPASPPPTNSKPMVPKPAAPSAGVPFGLESLPDWISAESREGDLDGVAPAEQAGLAQADMPGWLEALKPVGMATAALSGKSASGVKNNRTTDSLKTNTGPLSPKSNPPVPSVSLPYNPPAPLEPNIQKQYASMMDTVLTQESSKPKPAQKEKTRRSRLIWAILVAAILVLLLLLAIFGFKLIPMPQLFSAETVTFYNTVETLPQNAPVLIALDYSPSFAAELQPISQTLMDQLEAKEARVSFISTEPTGPFFADLLLQQTNQKDPSYNLAEKTANLGYLAGSTAGLQGFALRPTVVIQRGWNGGDVWNSPALSGVTDLSKFAMIVVVSESVDTARDWIEQIQPQMGSVPLLIASSSQNGPLLQPYTASNQVKGLVAGIPGWAAYENILGKGKGSEGLWNLYLVGQILAVLVILVGVILRFTSENQTRTRKEK